MEAQRAASAESERARFRFAVRLAILCVAGCVIGFLPMAWALHTTNLEAGRMAWALGPPLGQALVLTTLVLGWMRWTRDEW